jgi:hypothetical protein
MAEIGRKGGEARGAQRRAHSDTVGHQPQDSGSQGEGRSL